MVSKYIDKIVKVSNRGGVAMYVANSIHVEPVHIPNSFNNVQILLNQVTINGETVLIGCIYRSNSSKTSTLMCLTELLNIVESCPGISDVMFAGDFNEKLLSSETHRIFEFFCK